MKRLWRWLSLVTAWALCVCAACARPVEGVLPEPGEGSVTAAPPAPAGGGGEGAVLPPTPTLAYPGTYGGTPTPNPTRVGQPQDASNSNYVVRAGDTLTRIALAFGCTVEEIIAANSIADPDSLRVGQTLVIPIAPDRTGPALKLIPDSELVYSPAYVGFDVAGFVAAQDGYLASYAEEVEDELRTGAEVVQLVAQRFSVGPRVLLALLELQAGWVTHPDPPATTRVYPLGHVHEGQEGLFEQLEWAADKLNEGYYGWKSGARGTVRLADGVRALIAPEMNAGTAGVQNCLAAMATWDRWLELVGPEGFPATYSRLFGHPFAYTVDPLVPEGLVQPELRLPWEAGETWYLTGGPHGGWGPGSGMAAVDFTPHENLGCQPAEEWATAAAAGRVVRSENGEVLIDLDGDGFEQTGWVLFYLHIYVEGRVEAGAFVERGWRIGHPSCEGGASDATHLHFARRYNGEWVPAGSGPVPLVLSGWTVHEGVLPYDGTMTRGDEVRQACECAVDDFNGLVSDNAAPDKRQVELFAPLRRDALKGLHIVMLLEV